MSVIEIVYAAVDRHDDGIHNRLHVDIPEADYKLYARWPM